VTSRYVPPPGSIPTLPVPALVSIRRLHLIGIGGAGMRNLARLFLARGIAVSGSDLWRVPRPRGGMGPRGSARPTPW
jgi:hypothetical protein